MCAYVFAMTKNIGNASQITTKMSAKVDIKRMAPKRTQNGMKNEKTEKSAMSVL